MGSVIITPDVGSGGGGGGAWGDITGTLSDQTDLQAALDAKQAVANITQSIPLNSTSETLYPSAKAVYDFAAIAVAGLMEIKGNLDCSTNPNYPAASVGDTYYVTVAGKIGGASGITVEIGDAIVCKVDNAGGTQAAVGSSWFILEHNLQGALLAANNLSDVASPSTALTNLGGAPLSPAVNAQTGTTYTLDSSDAGKVVTLTNASAITVTCSGLADGNEVVFEQLGAGQVTFATGTLTVRHVASLTKTAGQYARVYARVSGSNIIFCGDMSA
jgi:archaellum component FlaG (FlaF/FlaG flagellin family)